MRTCVPGLPTSWGVLSRPHLHWRKFAMSRSRSLTLLAALTLLGLTTPGAFAEEHPRLHAAVYEMRHARTELKEAKHDFGGHRAKALTALDEAINQIDK